jgi:hypothetical protein
MSGRSHMGYIHKKFLTTSRKLVATLLYKCTLKFISALNKFLFAMPFPTQINTLNREILHNSVIPALLAAILAHIIS